MIHVQGNYGPPATANAYEASRQLSTKNCRVHTLTVTNKDSSTAWIQIFDAGSATGEAFEYPLPTNSVLSLTSLRFGTGLFVRGVTAAGGSTPVGNVLKIAAWMDTPWPVSS